MKRRASGRPAEIGMVSFQVEAINARTRSRDQLPWHQLQCPLHSRIHYEKHARFTAGSKDEMVRFTSTPQGNMSNLTTDETDERRSEAERARQDRAFHVSRRNRSGIYVDGRMYYLVPKGKEAQDTMPS